MKIIEPSFEILRVTPNLTELIEFAARTCYKSEKSTTNVTSVPLIEHLLQSGHESVIEHASATVKIICDRGISHEIVRHRLCSFSQESTRYCNYSKDRFENQITVIKPFFWEIDTIKYAHWKDAMEYAENYYLDLLDMGATPQQARAVLPISTKTEIVMTANMREWRTIFKQRCSQAAHPQMRQIMLPLLRTFYRRICMLFDDIYNKYKLEIDTKENE